MIVHVAISAGWTLDYVGNHIDLPTLATLSKYWTSHPPIHLLMAAYVGYKAPEVQKPVDQVLQNAMIAQMVENAPKYVFKPPVKVNHGD